jgi:2-succinyl-6-hydroxy-2,4-cyclohexadiene-1-carboxylate synthase
MAVIGLHGFLGDPSDWELGGGDAIDALSLLTCLEACPTSFHEAVLAITPQIPKGATLLGYSMGARVALYMALYFPQNVSRLVMISGSPGIENDVDRQDRYRKDLALADRMETQPWPEFLREWYQQPLFEPFRSSSYFETVFKKRLAQDPHQMAQVLRVLSVGNQPSLWGRLPELTIPVTLVSGQLDAKYTQISQKMVQLCPHFRWIQVPHVGHAVLAELEPNQQRALLRGV